MPLLCLWLLAGTPQSEAVGLLERYPTKLTAGDTAPDRARPWEFTAADVFRVSRFVFEMGKELRIEVGTADLGIGHCVDGAVWAVVIPREDGKLTSSVTRNEEAIAHVWLRFHPREITRVFPPETVFADGASHLAAQMRAIANAKFGSSWHAGPNAMIPEPKDLTVDVDTKDGPRRFFGVDTDAQTARYVPAFEDRNVKPPPAFSAEAAATAFDQLWQAFDRDYAMFVLRPEVDWAKLREQYRPKALASKSTHEFAEVCADMLKPLRDLHVWMTVAGVNVPVFNRPRSANSNPSAHRAILGDLKQAGRVQWAITRDRIGFIAIYGWNTGPEIPAQVDEALEQMRDTRGLIIDVRLNGGGDEPTAGKVAGRFLPKQFVYSYSQFRNGPSHTNLTEKYERRIGPQGSWRYSRPVVLLIGEKCMSSNESFIAMMSGDPEITIMGDHTCGSSGNPRIVKLPFDMTVSVPRWIDYLPDGTPLDERGFLPQVEFKPEPGAFNGDRDDLLKAALERLRQLSLPGKPIEASASALSEENQPGRKEETEDERTRRQTALVPDYGPEIAEDAGDLSRPKVIWVSPVQGEEAVPAARELRIRFDRPMDPLSVKLDWELGGFLDCDFAKYDSDRHEFVIPVRLAPGADHRIVVNKPRFWCPGERIGKMRETFPRDGFQSVDHDSAGLFVWRFHTQGGTVSSNGSPPKVVQISPEPGSAVALLTFVQIQFDQPMMPPSDARPYVVSVVGPKSPGGGAICHVQYEPTNHTFRIPLLSPLKDPVKFTVLGRKIEVPRTLTPNGKVTFSLAGFRSAAGVPAAPVKIEYRVSGVEMARAERKRIEAAAKDPRLLALLEQFRQRRTQLSSVAERIQTLSLGIRDNLFVSLESTSAAFKWQAPGRFYGDVGDMMCMPAFRVGSDGQSWWYHWESGTGKGLEFCPVAQMHQVNSSFCDPFGLTRTSPAQAASDIGLSYAGVTNLGSGECHLLEAWMVETFGGVVAWGRFRQWWIDSRTALPAKLGEFYEHGLSRTRFFYDAVNEALPAESFAVPRIKGLSPTAPEPLNADYTSRYVKIGDGSDGRMSLRWGKQGPKGSCDGGMN